MDRVVKGEGACGMRNAECGMRNAECEGGGRDVGYGELRSYTKNHGEGTEDHGENAECGMRNAESRRRGDREGAGDMRERDGGHKAERSGNELKLALQTR